MIQIANSSSKMKSARFAIIYCLFLSGCRAERTLTQLPPQILQISKGQALLIQLNEGEVQVTGSDGEQIQVNGQTFFPNEIDYKVVPTKDQIQLIVNYDGRKGSENPISSQVGVPHGTEVKIDTEYASIAVQDYEGDL